MLMFFIGSFGKIITMGSIARGNRCDRFIQNVYPHLNLQELSVGTKLEVIRIYPAEDEVSETVNLYIECSINGNPQDLVVLDRGVMYDPEDPDPVDVLQTHDSSLSPDEIKNHLIKADLLDED